MHPYWAEDEMLRKLLLVLPVCVMSLSLLRADATLKGTLNLDIDQARKVDTIQAKYHTAFASKRQERNREARKLRRARIANDRQQIAEQEQIVNRLHAELKQIQLREDDEIRQVLSPAQRTKFDEYLKLRKEMIGSSRDAKDF
jgi:cobalamin biosynthesis Mg chelatase CobN